MKTIKPGPLFWKIFALGIGVWLLHTSPFFIGLVLNSGIENSSVFVYRGELGMAKDLMVYATQIQHAVFNPHFFRTDPMIFEHAGKTFPDGNLVILYCAFFLWIFKNWELMLLFSSLPLTITSCFILYKITQTLYSKTIYFGSFVLISSVFFLTQFSDFLNIFKVIGGLQNHGISVTGFDKFVMGTAQRFPQNQISTVLFLAWFLALVKALKQGKNIHYICLALSLIALQYTYFFYWPFALVSTLSLLFFQWGKSHQPWLMLFIYILGTFPFWVVYLDFNALPYATEYQIKMRGYQTHPSLAIHLFSILTLLLAFRKQLNPFTLLIIFSAAFVQLGMNHIVYFFPANHLYCQIFKICSFIFLVNLYGVHYRKKTSFDLSKLLLLNYWIVFVFINLKFIIGFNVQPYHWVNHAFYSIFILSLIPIYLEIQEHFLPRKTAIYFALFVTGIAVSSGAIYANSSHRFWNFNTEEQEVLDFFKKQKKSVIGGNNIAFLITCAVQTNQQMLTGISHTNHMSNQQAYHRLIKNFKEMGYSNEQILAEANKYKLIKATRTAFETNNDSLSKTWPDNTTLFAESVSHYFEDPVKYMPSFEMALKNYAPNKYPCKLDHLVIYKPTFIGNLSQTSYKVVLENKNFCVLKK